MQQSRYDQEDSDNGKLLLDERYMGGIRNC